MLLPPIPTMPHRFLLASLLFLCVSLPLRAETLTLKFLGPDDKPIAGATVLTWAIPKPHNWEGSWRNVQSDENGIVVLDYEPDGKIDTFGFNTKTSGYTPFYSEWNDPKNDPIPREYTVKLEKAETVGGIVTDDTGKPLAGATVWFSFPWGERSRIVMGNFGCSVQTVTDAEGNWRVGFIPAEHLATPTTFSLKHPEFTETIHQSIPLSRFAANANGQFTETLSMERGVTVSGKVTDGAGKVIANATVYASNAADSFRPFSTTTDDEGMFSFKNAAKANGQYLLVRADGFAPELKNGLWFKDDMQPVSFTLMPGKTLRVKVVGTDGKAIPNAIIYVERWRTLSELTETLGGRRETDGEGKLVWANAPAGEITLSIHASRYRAVRGQTVTADDSEHTFTLRPTMKVSATVIDAKTGQPIPDFRIVKGSYSPGRAQPYWWNDYDTRMGHDGGFEQLEFDEQSNFVIKIEAVGYAPSISREISPSETDVKLEFALEEQGEIPQKQGLSGIVLDPDGKPAAKATVALAKRNQSPYIVSGTLIEGANCLSALTNDEGRFSLPPEEEDDDIPEQMRENPNFHKLFVLHESGFAEIDRWDFEERNSKVSLVKWASVEGTIFVGSKPGKNVALQLQPYEEPYRPVSSLYVPRANFGYNVKSDGEGKFLFEKVPPGKVTICIEIRYAIRPDGGFSSVGSHHETVDAVSGETTTVKLGGVGCPIIGKLVVPPNLEESPNWNFCIVWCVPTIAAVSADYSEARKLSEESRKMLPEEILNEADREIQQQLYREWLETEEGKAYEDYQNNVIKPLFDALNAIQRELLRQRGESEKFLRCCAVDSDGTFRIEDVPAGDWTLTVELTTPMQDIHSRGKELGELTLPITIAEIPGGQSDEPLNLGTLRLERAEESLRLIAVGAEAPDFELERLGANEEMIRLSDYHGKIVVLEFWATWCGPCVAQIPELVKFYEKVKENPNVVMMGISIDENEKLLLNFLAKKPEMAWIQLRAGSDSPLAKGYGVWGVPAMVVVGPEGKVIAVNPGMRELERLVGK